MGKARVLILGHSFIRRLRDHITSSQDGGYNAKFAILTPEFICKWHGVGGRTIAKVVKYDLGVVKDFGPDIIILQLGSNDLVDSSALTVGSHLEDLVVLLHDHYKVDLICVCQTLRRSPSEVGFNKNVSLLTKYLKTVLEPIPYAFFWSHRGFWNTKSQFLSRDGVHLNGKGQHKLYRSMRGAVLKCLRLLDHISVPNCYCKLMVP